MDRSHDTVKPYIELRNLTKIYKDHAVIENMNMELAKGQFLSLLGQSGSGKTTLLRMLSGLIPIDGGQVIVDGQDLSHVPPHKRNFGMVFQQYALFPHMTVWDNVAYGLKARKEKSAVIKERVEKYLKLVGLEHLANRKPKQLSGGQQQRVSLARALAVEPVVMLFDEPMSNLDARLKEQLLKEIRGLQRKLGFTAVYVTHDQNEAMYLSDKIAVLKDGKIEQLGTPREIMTAPQTAFVADFFGYTNQLSGAILQEDLTIRVGDVTIPAGHIEEGSKPGDRGELLLRPNAIIFEPAKHEPDALDSARDLWPATVVDARYLGGTELTIRMNGISDQELTAFTTHYFQPLPAEGDQVYVRFLADSIAFYREGRG